MSESTRLALLSSLLAATPTAAIGLYLWWGERFTGLVMAFFFAFSGGFMGVERVKGWFGQRVLGP